MDCCCYLRNDQDLLAEGKSQNERRFGRILKGHALFVVGFWEEYILTAEIAESEKLDASETYPRRLNAKEVLVTQKKMEKNIFVADGSAKLSWRDYEFQQPTLRQESTEKRENLSGVSHGEQEEFRPEENEDDAEDREHCWSIEGYFLSYWTKSAAYVPREESFFIAYYSNYWTKLLREEIYDAGGGLEKRQNIWGKNKFQVCWYCSEEAELCILSQFYARIRSDEKIQRKFFT